MDRRPPNPRRLSRKLFSKKPQLRGAFIPENTPKYIFGKPYEITPVRKDVEGYKGVVGDDFMTYELFTDAVRAGKITKEFIDSLPITGEFNTYDLTPDRVKNFSRYHYGKLRSLFLLDQRDRPTEYVSKRSEGDPKERRRTEAYYKDRLDSIRAGKRLDTSQVDAMEFEEMGKTQKKVVREGGSYTRKGMPPPTVSFTAEQKNDIARKKVADRIAEAKDRRKQRNPKGYGERATDRKIGRILRNQKVEPLRMGRDDEISITGDEVEFQDFEANPRGKYHYPEVVGEIKYTSVPDKIDFSGNPQLGRDFEELLRVKKGGWDAIAENKRDKEELKALRETAREKGLRRKSGYSKHLLGAGEKVYDRFQSAEEQANAYRDRFKGKTKEATDNYLATAFTGIRDDWDFDFADTNYGSRSRLVAQSKDIQKAIDIHNKIHPESKLTMESAIDKTMSPFLSPEERKRLLRLLQKKRPLIKHKTSLQIQEKGKVKEEDALTQKELSEMGFKGKRGEKEIIEEVSKLLVKQKKAKKIPFVSSEQLQKAVAESDRGYNYLADAGWKSSQKIDSRFKTEAKQIGDRRLKKAERIVEHMILDKTRPPELRLSGVRISEDNKREVKKLSFADKSKYIEEYTDAEDDQIGRHAIGLGDRRKSPKHNETKLEQTGKVVRLGDENFVHKKYGRSMIKGENPRKGGKTYVLYGEGEELDLDGRAGEEKFGKPGSFDKIPKTTMRKTSDGRYILTRKGYVYRGRKKSRMVKIVRKRDPFNNPNFVMKTLGRSGGGKRVFHLNEEGDKGFKEVGVNQYRKQADAWKAFDVDSTPFEKSQLRGLRDRRTHGTRLIGRGYDPRRIDRSKEYKSARSEALIQMRINESAGVRDAKSKAQKEIKEIRVSEAQKALNLRLAKETAEKTTEALKAKNAGITHSYNVNIRNQTAATLLGSNPDELNKLLRKGGGLALIKAMVRKGEIVDVSTIGQLDLGQKQKESLIRLHNEGGQFIEGQEYFFRTLDDLGQTKTRRGYLNKGGERSGNLVLTYLNTLDDGSQEREQFIVPKANVLRPDDYTSTTASGKQQKPEPKQLDAFELDLLGSPQEGGTEVPLPDDLSHFGQQIKQDPKTGVKSLVKQKSAGVYEDSPKTQDGIFGAGDIVLELDEGSEGGSSDDPFDFELDADQTQEEELPTPYGKKPPRPQETDLYVDTEGLAEEAGIPTEAETPPDSSELIASLGAELDAVDEKGELKFHEAPESLDLAFTKEVGQPAPADLLLAHQLQQEGKEGPLTGGLQKSPSPKPSIPTQSPKLSQFVEATPPEEQFFQKPQPEPEPEPAPKKEKKKKKKEPRKVVILDIDQRVDNLFKGDFPTNAQGRKYTSDPFKGHDFNEYYLPEQFYREGKDMSNLGFRTDSLKDVEPGQTAIWSTKHGDKKSQKLLVINASQATHLFRGLKGQTRVNDKGNQQGKGDKQLGALYKKVLQNIKNGKTETAINDKVLLRLLGVIEPKQ